MKHVLCSPSLRASPPVFISGHDSVAQTVGCRLLARRNLLPRSFTVKCARINFEGRFSKAKLSTRLVVPGTIYTRSRATDCHQQSSFDDRGSNHYWTNARRSGSIIELACHAALRLVSFTSRDMRIGRCTDHDTSPTVIYVDSEWSPQNDDTDETWAMGCRAVMESRGRADES